MATKVFMEALSPTMEEGRLVTWHKHEGDAIAAGDVLAEVETDKAVMELTARGEGVLRKVLVKEGQTVAVGSLVGIIAAEDEDISGVGGEAPAPPPPAAPIEAVAPAPETPAGAGSERPLRASPLARRMARERGLSLEAVRGSGPGGRIVMRDLDAAPTGVAAASAAHEDVPLSQVRKAIAKRLAQSLGPVPHFFLTTEVDMQRAAEARTELNAHGEARVSFNDIIVKAVAAALRQHRACNAWWQDDHIRYFDEVHIGMAVAIEEGLITPVIRHADRKSLRAIGEESRALAERARARKLTPEEYTGSTFSISNLGMFGIDQFTAVINPPEAGILAIGTITDKPVAMEGQVVVRPRMRITMSCDHRVIDGATGALFLETVRHLLENPLAFVW